MLDILIRIFQWTLSTYYLFKLESFIDTVGKLSYLILWVLANMV